MERAPMIIMGIIKIRKTPSLKTTFRIKTKKNNKKDMA
jgi:hypothetical protein